MPMNDFLAVLPQYLLPKQALTALAGTIASHRGGAWTTSLIRRFVARYRVDMNEAADPDIAHYASFNDFFTRALKPGARPLAESPWLCPVDGAISQFGRIERDQVFQAKGHSYSTTALVGKGEGIGLFPVEPEMHGVSGDHFQESWLIGILKAQLEPETVSEREPVVGDVAGVYSGIFVILPPLDDITPVRSDIEPDIGGTRLRSALKH